eukprot:gene35144-17933_t
MRWEQLIMTSAALAFLASQPSRTPRRRATAARAMSRGSAGGSSTSSPLCAPWRRAPAADDAGPGRDAQLPAVGQAPRVPGGQHAQLREGARQLVVGHGEPREGPPSDARLS